MAVISEYTETPMRAVLTNICTYPLELMEKLMVLKTSTSTDVFRKLTAFPVLFMLTLWFYNSMNNGYYMKRN